MKSTIILILLSFSLCEYDVEYHSKIVAQVNKLRTTWTAKITNKDLTPSLGLIETPKELLPPLKTRKTSLKDLPESFDLREKYPKCESLLEIRDQSKCGSCWAFAAAEVMSDRICIKSNQEKQTRVSAQDLVTCCDICGNGCFGGMPPMAFLYWQSNGIVSGGLYGDKKTCKPYFLPPCDDHMHKCHDYVDTPQCEDKCIPEYGKTYEADKTFGASAYSLLGEESIMEDIYENGSVVGTFTVYEDFADYSKGIYQHVTGEYKGGHAVKIIGWGVENGVKYWLIANSWNPTWGENGYFRLLRGENECGIEMGVCAGDPK